MDGYITVTMPNPDSFSLLTGWRAEHTQQIRYTTDRTIDENDVDLFLTFAIPGRALVVRRAVISLCMAITLDPDAHRKAGRQALEERGKPIPETIQKKSLESGERGAQLAW
ncbi:hypothetical protein IF2G_02094 [Cordyceps javanica]|nr:hypothetical protein IF2G_02094 [Cordyceps javanica]